MGERSIVNDARFPILLHVMSPDQEAWAEARVTQSDAGLVA